jgi:tetratricopeptide (TPR) repeat protein
MTTVKTTVKVIQPVKTVNEKKNTNSEPERIIKAQESYPTTAQNCTCEHASKLYGQGKYKEAAFYYNKTAEIMLQQYKHENSDIADMRYGQGLCYYMLNDYAQADKWLTASINMYKRVKDTSNQIAVTMAVLGDTRNRQNKYGVGDQLVRDAIALLSHKRQQKSADYADYEYCVSLLATSYDWQDRREEALPLHKQALALKKQLKDIKAIEAKQSRLKKSTA